MRSDSESHGPLGPTLDEIAPFLLPGRNKLPPTAAHLKEVQDDQIIRLLQWRLGVIGARHSGQFCLVLTPLCSLFTILKY